VKLDSQGSVAAFRRYRVESARPLVSLIFVAPLIVAYEAGVLLLGGQSIRNGVDVWLRQLLEWLGFSQHLLLPLLTCAILLGWHHLARDRWQVRPLALYGMFLESLLFGFLLLVLVRLEGTLFSTLTVGSAQAAIAAEPDNVSRLVSFCGAGIYEELLFRLMLFPTLAALLRGLGTTPRVSLLWALLLTSVAFATAHYRLDLLIGNYHLVTVFGDSFAWGSFLFRFGAGVFFTVLFLERGFGITAGAHACYDILVSLG